MDLWQPLAVVIVCWLLMFSVVMLLPILLVIKASQSIFGPAIDKVLGPTEEVREHNWRHADARERERMVRKSCGWRIIGRVIGAGALVAGAFVAVSPGLTVMCCLTAWRVVKPMTEELRDACSYRSAGTKDEPPYLF